MTKKYASPVSTHYHVDREGCFAINNPEKYAERSDEYVQYKNLDPCPHCVEGRNIGTQNKGQKVSNLAKSLKYGTEYNG